MGLLEIVKDKINDQNKINYLKDFSEEKLGKGVIVCGDTPGFRKQNRCICYASSDDRSCQYGSFC